MKTRFKSLATVCMALLVTAGSGYGQLRVGPYLSMADADEEHGYGGGVRATQPLADNLLLDFRASSMTYEHFDAFPLELGLFGALPSGAWEWYGGGGFGYFIYKLDIDTLDDPDPELGFFVAGGTSVSVAEGIRLFAEVKYTSASVHVESDRTAIPGGGTRWTSADRGLDGMGANIGILWQL